MFKSKKTKAEKEQAKNEFKSQGSRALFILGFTGNLASAVMYTMLINNPEIGMQVLASVNIVTAAYFLYKAIN